VQDDWRVRPNFTLSYGLRYETQNIIHDHGDFAPRVAFAWGIGGGQKTAPKTVLRAGYGFFYERFTEMNALTAERENGITQLQFIAQSGTALQNYPTIPAKGDLQQSSPTLYQIDPRYRSPYIMQGAVSLERQLTKQATVSISYLNSRGFNQLLTRNINAPIPTENAVYPIHADDPALRPCTQFNLNCTLGPLENLYQYTTEGIFRQHQLILSSNVRAGSKLTLFGYYTLNNVHSNTSGGFPTDQYNLDLDYGRSTYDIRHRVFFGGSIAAPYGFRLSPFLIATSGTPYSVTLGTDWNGDSLFNDRPAFSGSCTTPTNPSCYNQQPQTTTGRIPINSLTGPPQFVLNLRLSKTFGFGKEMGNNNNGTPPQGGGPPGGGGGRSGGGGGGGRGGGGGGFGRGPGAGMGAIFGPGNTGRRYNLTLSVNARNVLNRENLAVPIGNLSSPNFGQSVALAGGPFSSAAASRKIELQAAFSF